MENADDRFATMIIPNCKPTPSQDEKLQSCHFARELEVFPEDSQMIIPNCRPTYSQEEKLRSCHFARELEVFKVDLQTSSAIDEATRTIIVSLPDSADECQTPPEQQYHSLNSSNDGKVPPEEEAMMVDDESKQETWRTHVDLTKDSNNPGFWEKSHGVLIEDDGTVMVDVDVDGDRIGGETGVIEIEAEIGVTELPTCKAFVEMPPREEDERVSEGKSKTAGMNADGKGKKGELRCWMKEQERSSGGVGDGDYAKHRVLLKVLDKALKVLMGEITGVVDGDGDGGDKDSDFLETAKRRGMTFPRPRWWPPEAEGFEG